VKLLLVLALTGCATSRYLAAPDGPMHQCRLPVLIATSNNVPASDRHFITEAIDWWNFYLGYEVFMDMGIVPFPPDDLRARSLVGVGTPLNYTVKATTVAQTHLNSYANGCISYAYVGLIRPLGTLTTHDAALVVRHEFGHLLGLKDATERNTLMHGYIPDTLTDKDLLEVEHYALKLFY